MIVSKFGGTSVQSSDAIRRVKNILTRNQEQTFIVVSALSKVTDTLVRIIEKVKVSDRNGALDLLYKMVLRHKEIAYELNILDFVENQILVYEKELSTLIEALSFIGEVSPRSTDKILSYGELLSSYIIFHYLFNEGFDIVYLDPKGIIKTDSNFTRAEIDFQLTKNVLQKFISSKHKYYITGGFVGSTLDSQTTTLSRGGSDYSAAAIAAILNANELEIWADVAGIMTSDPRIVSNAKTIKELTYSEASELAYFGAKVLHPKTIFPAVQSGIPVKVLNSLKPNLEGTTITLNSLKVNIVKAIAFRRNITVITIKSNRMLGAIGYLAKVFDIFRKYETSVDLLSSSEVSISLTIDNPDNLNLIVDELNQISEVSTLSNQAIVSVIGEGLKDSTAIASRIFYVLRDCKIRMVSMGASDINFSFVIDEEKLENVVIRLHNEFFAKNEYPELFIEVTNE